MQVLKYLILSLIAFIVSTTMYNCKKDVLYDGGDAKLSFSLDTVIFDTTFVTVGSTTKFLTVRNTLNQRINIANIFISGGDLSPFRINVDGIAGNSIKDVEIGPNDSLYIFIEVTVNPDMEPLPFVIDDILNFETNGNMQQVPLIAYGQNAHFHFGEIISTPTVWVDDLPHVIFGSILIDNTQLTLMEGVNIHLYTNSTFFVGPGSTLKSEGSIDSMVTFQGARLEYDYQNVAGQWRGIHLLSRSHSHEINYTKIQNAQFGVRVDSLPVVGTNNLIISNSIIQNISTYGILGFTTAIRGSNLLIDNCGLESLQLAFGGAYEFNHCTLTGRGATQQATVRVSNYFIDATNTANLADIVVRISNTIIHGFGDNELNVDMIEEPMLTMDYQFENCLIKAENDVVSGVEFINCINNENPLFEDELNSDFHLQAVSPCVDAGVALGWALSDIEGKVRVLPDIGCFEF